MRKTSVYTDYCLQMTLYKILFVFLVTSFCLVNAELKALCYFNHYGGCSSSNASSAELTKEECCLGDGYWYMEDGSDECMQCVVYGFEESYVRVYEGSTLEATVGIMKGESIAQNIILISSAISGSAKGAMDYEEFNTVFRISSGLSSEVAKAVVTILSDSVALEGEETFQLNLRLVRPVQLLSYEFIKDTLDVHIIDTTTVSFKLAELNDYRTREEDDFVVVSVAKNPSIKLAKPVSLMISPLTLEEAATRGFRRSIADGSVSATELDFQSATKDGFKFTFPASEDSLGSTSEVIVHFPIVDDDVNEVIETFVILLEVAPEESTKVGISFDRNFSLCRIEDDDDIDIGFEAEGYTIQEGHETVTINLSKFGRITEQDFDLDLYAYKSGSGSLSLETDVNITSIFTVKFLSTEQLYSITFDIFDDSTPEYSEQLTLSVGPSSGGIFGCSKAHGCSSMISVVIEDNDVMQVGFTSSLIQVAEDSGAFEVCVVVTEPGSSTSLEVFLYLQVEIKPGSAEEGDYLRKHIEMEINNEQRNSCFTMFVVDDDIIEEKEKFSLSLLQTDYDQPLPLLSFSPSVVTVVISDNDFELGFEHELYIVNEADGSVEVCVVLRGSDPSMPIEITLSTVESLTATAAGDYSPVSSTLRFDVSIKRVCTSIPLLNDDTTEHAEQFHVVLEAITPGINLDGRNTTVIIVDDDVVLGFENEVYTVNEGDGEVEVCVSVLSGAPQRSVIVSLCTENNNAIDTYDFETTTSQLTFNKGGSARNCFLVPIVNDGLVEAEQQFRVRMELLSPVPGFHLSSSYATVIILDDDGISTEEGICSAEEYELVNEQDKKQEEVVESIVADIAPELIAGIFNTTVYSHPNSTTEPVSVIEVVYTSLSEKFDVKPSETRFNSFVEAVTEISTIEEEACSGDAVRSEDIPRLVNEFKHAFSRPSRSRDLAAIRSVYGKMLCIKRQVGSTSRRRKRETPGDPLELCPDGVDCECPPGGLDGDIVCPCQFFRCLDPDDHLKPIFGFVADAIQCLAFVIDTTGSMETKISAAKKIILEFVRSEEDVGEWGCYMLVPFNDVGPDSEHVPDPSVGPISVAETGFLDDLQEFYKNVTDLTASGGGDRPEYALDAMLKALKYQVFDDNGNPGDAMIPGSQIVVITDAPSKNPNITDEVINVANTKEVCIHFFVEGSYGTGDGVYQRVADETTGTLVSPFSGWEIATFTSSYRDSPCDHSLGRRQARSTITLTRPSGSTVTVSISKDFAVHSESHPEAGEWLACVSHGMLEISVNQDFSLDATILYLKERSGALPVASVSPPNECSAARVMVASSRSSLLLEAYLSLLDGERNVVQKSPLQRCSDALIASMTFPQGTYTYQIDAIDTSGTPISYHIDKEVTFKAGKYNLESDSEEEIEIKLHDQIRFSVSLTNLNAYPSTLHFSGLSPGFSVHLQPSQALVSPGEVVRVNATVLVTSSSIRRGSSYNIEVEATDGCATLTYTKTVRIQAAAATPPPPDACGCLNGGTCLVFTRRGRVFKRCQCPPGYRGHTCSIETTS